MASYSSEETNEISRIEDISLALGRVKASPHVITPGGTEMSWLRIPTDDRGGLSVGGSFDEALLIEQLVNAVPKLIKMLRKKR